MWSIWAAGRPREGRTGLWNRGGGKGPILGLLIIITHFSHGKLLACVAFC